MRKITLSTCLFVLLGSALVLAQAPVPAADTVLHPVQQGDPALRTMPDDLNYIEDKKRITADELPGPVRETLESSAQYEQWQRAAIFHDKNRDEYEVQFKEAGKTTSYRFNSEGKPVPEDD